MAKDSKATRERILDVAERCFAVDGFDGVSLRTLAAAAGTSIALVHYHFGDKLAVYRAVWLRRYEAPEFTHELVDAEFDFARPVEALIHDLVQEFVRPVAMMSLDEEGRGFCRILGRELSDPKQQERGILREFLGPSLDRLRVGFERALPELDPMTLEMGFQTMGGGLQAHLTRVGRQFARPDLADDALSGRHLGILVAYLVGGWLSLRSAALGPSMRSSKKENSIGEGLVSPNVKAGEP